ncbi:hypothetical protein BpHYR1_050846 [Brachionus plicatilis]|uniref:Uncharacterized protein n=1 Tax=Brachionus plicatilis TaxID=10195 RepID=A0A3M7PA72_BRAPC|nr:hypothetical protein BpHYR1_050846 [Brachionus plicatilis]
MYDTSRLDSFGRLPQFPKFFTLEVAWKFRTVIDSNFLCQTFFRQKILSSLFVYIFTKNKKVNAAVHQHDVNLRKARLDYAYTTVTFPMHKKQSILVIKVNYFNKFDIKIDSIT